MESKILSFDELIKRTISLKKQGKVIVQSYGVFDIIHPGIIQHLKNAKKQGDILVVTVINDKNVRLGPGRPVFNEKLRLENVISLQLVDYVALVDEKYPYECVRMLKPDIFAKGKAVRHRDQAIHGKIFKEEKNRNFGKTRIFETDGFSFQTQQLVNNHLSVYPNETKAYLKEFSLKYSFKDVADQLNMLKDLKVLLIGDGIIDEYHYCDAMGRSAKTPLVVNRYLKHEVFAGGVFALANHASSICEKVHLISLLGKTDSRQNFISDNLRPNVSTKFFFRNNSSTIIKKRYINQYHSQKIFEVNFLDDKNINEKLENDVAKYLKAEIPKYDIVLVSDFGHGFVTNRLTKLVASRAKKYAINTQTNAANSGYNLITRYKKPYFICLDESELRLAAQDRHADIEYLSKKIKKSVKAEYLIVTLGKNGSIGIDKQNEVNRTPVLSTKVIDTIGAGDAFFSYTAPCFAVGMPLDLVSFIGNVVGALAVQIIGNKKSVEKQEVLEFIHNLLQ